MYAGMILRSQLCVGFYTGVVVRLYEGAVGWALGEAS